MSKVLTLFACKCILIIISGFEGFVFVDFFEYEKLFDSLEGKGVDMVNFFMESVFEFGFELNLFKDDFLERLSGRRLNSVDWEYFGLDILG